MVPKHSVVKVFDHYPPHRACLTVCGVVAGIGTASYPGDTRPGAVCAVWGVGGIGMNIVQGCRLMGARAIVAVDIGLYAAECGWRPRIRAVGGVCHLMPGRPTRRRR